MYQQLWNESAQTKVPGILAFLQHYPGLFKGVRKLKVAAAASPASFVVSVLKAVSEREVCVECARVHQCVSCGEIFKLSILSFLPGWHHLQ
jgi:hypothetical protein